MQIVTFTDYSFGSNTYLVVNEEEGKAVLVDAGVPASQILEYLDRNGLELEAVLLTHGHPDHLLSLKDIVQATGARAYMHPADIALIRNIPSLFLRMLGLESLEIPEDIEEVKEGQTLRLAGMDFQVLHTPGHSEGSVCYLVNGALFAGDLIFRGSVGRTDFPGGSMRTLVQSVKDKVFTLPSDTRIYPGHMDSTVVGWEKKTNPFLLGI